MLAHLNESFSPDHQTFLGLIQLPKRVQLQNRLCDRMLQDPFAILWAPVAAIAFVFFLRNDAATCCSERERENIKKK